MSSSEIRTHSPHSLPSRTSGRLASPSHSEPSMNRKRRQRVGNCIDTRCGTGQSSSGSAVDREVRDDRLAMETSLGGKRVLETRNDERPTKRRKIDSVSSERQTSLQRLQCIRELHARGSPVEVRPSQSTRRCPEGLLQFYLQPLLSERPGSRGRSAEPLDQQIPHSQSHDQQHSQALTETFPHEQQDPQHLHEQHLREQQQLYRQQQHRLRRRRRHTVQQVLQHRQQAQRPSHNQNLNPGEHSPSDSTALTPGAAYELPFIPVHPHSHSQTSNVRSSPAQLPGQPTPPALHIAAASPSTANIRAPQTHRFVYFYEDDFIDPLPPPPPISAAMLSPWWVPSWLSQGELARQRERREFTEVQARSLDEAANIALHKGLHADELLPRMSQGPLPNGYTRSLQDANRPGSSTICTECDEPLLGSESSWFLRRCGHLYCKSCAASGNATKCGASHCDRDDEDDDLELMREVYI